MLINITESGQKVFGAHNIFHKEMIDEILENVQGNDLKVLTNALSEVSKFFEKKYQSFQ